MFVNRYTCSRKPLPGWSEDNAGGANGIVLIPREPRAFIAVRPTASSFHGAFLRARGESISSIPPLASGLFVNGAEEDAEVTDTHRRDRLTLRLAIKSRTSGAVRAPPRNVHLCQFRALYIRDDGDLCMQQSPPIISVENNSTYV